MLAKNALLNPPKNAYLLQIFHKMPLKAVQACTNKCPAINNNFVCGLGPTKTPEKSTPKSGVGGKTNQLCVQNLKILAAS